MTIHVPPVEIRMLSVTFEPKPSEDLADSATVKFEKCSSPIVWTEEKKS